MKNAINTITERAEFKADSMADSTPTPIERWNSVDAAIARIKAGYGKNDPKGLTADAGIILCNLARMVEADSLKRSTAGAK